MTNQIADARKDAAEQRQIALDALAETRKTAEAAKVSADSAERSLSVVERGYLAVDKASLTKPEVGKVPIATFEFRNEGRVPLTVARMWISLNMLPNPPGLPDPPVYPDKLDDLPFLVGASCPSVQQVRTTKLPPLTQDDMTAIMKGQKNIYVWGRYEYYDGFKPGRVLRFAMLYDPHEQALVHAPPASYHEYS